MKSMYIGSGDVHALLMGRDTKGHQLLLSRFVSDEKPYYNAVNSPIDALRTGAILEGKFFETLSDDYFAQVVVESEEMDVFKCSLDFAKIEGGKVVWFKEFKTVTFTDFLEIEPIRNADQSEQVKFVQKTYKYYYNQIQQQMYCTGLDAAEMVFLAVYSYEDEESYTRDIKPNEYISVAIPRDEQVIQKIKDAANIFQLLKNHYK